MKIKLTSVFVDDQDKALKFYTEVLGFVKKRDLPTGNFRWLTVGSPEEPEGTELLLEPNDNPAAKTYQKSILEQGIPATAFLAEDIQQEYERLKKLGVVFSKTPIKTGEATVALFDDTCGNLIQLYQVGTFPSKSDRSISTIGRKKMRRYAYTEFREKVEHALQGEKDGLTWDQLKEKGEIRQTRLCYTWASQLGNEIGLTRKRRGRNVYWKLKKDNASSS